MIYTICAYNDETKCHQEPTAVLINSRTLKYLNAKQLCDRYDTSSLRDRVTDGGYTIKKLSCLPSTISVVMNNEIKNDILTSNDPECKEYNPDRKYTCIHLDIVKEKW